MTVTKDRAVQALEYLETYSGPVGAIEVLRQFIEQSAATPQPAERWKVGNEFAPYHPDASHVTPDYREGWNACYRAAAQDVRDAERYRWLRDRLSGADFDWNGTGLTVLMFAIPRRVPVSNDCDATVDSAIRAAMAQDTKGE